MKKKIFFSVLFLVLVSPLLLSAQTEDRGYAKISANILLNYHPDSAALAKFCRIGCIFVKFKVDPQGEVIDLSFSGDADSTKFITDALTKAIISLKEDIWSISKLKKSGREIIQPFIYNYQAGCSFPKVGTTNATDYYLSYINVMSNMNHVLKSLYNILKFSNGEVQSLDAVLLSPIGVSNAVMH